MAFQIRRGTNAQRLGITPLQGELIYTTDTKSLYVGDGTTAGGTAVGGGGGGATDLNGLTDVVINGGTLVSGQVLKYDGTNWVNGTDATGGGGATTLDGLTDVVISGTPSVGQVLKYDGTNWVNGTDSTGGGGGGATYNISAETAVGGTILRLSGSDLTTDDVTFAEGTNITITRTDANTITIDSLVAENDVLDYVGPWLEAGTNTGISFTFDPFTRALTTTVDVGLANLNDVNLVTPPLADDVLKYDSISGKWIAGTALLIDDPSPTLSAPLDLNGQLINGTGGITIEGNIDLDGGIVIGGPTNYVGGLTIISQANNTTISPILTVANYSGAGSLPFTNYLRGRGTPDVPLSAAVGDTIGGFRFGGIGTNTTAAPEAAATIFALVDPTGVIGTTSTSGALVFQTRNDAGVLNSVLVLNKDGIIRVANNTVLPAAVDEATGPVAYLTVRVTTSPTTFNTYYLPLLQAAP